MDRYRSVVSCFSYIHMIDISSVLLVHHNSSYLSYPIFVDYCFNNTPYNHICQTFLQFLDGKILH